MNLQKKFSEIPSIIKGIIALLVLVCPLISSGADQQWPTLT
jgi:hypothetical protein